MGSAPTGPVDEVSPRLGGSLESVLSGDRLHQRSAPKALMLAFAMATQKAACSVRVRVVERVAPIPRLEQRQDVARIRTGGHLGEDGFIG